MKDFCKWLGVNEKIAKIIVWLFIFMAFLIVTNAMLESIGFPYYKLTVDNLSKVTHGKFVEYLLSWILSLLSFYSVIFLVFEVKEFKSIFKYSIVYLVLSIVGRALTNSAINQVFLFIYMVGFCFLYSRNNWKYLAYGIISYIINVFIQYIIYWYKGRFIDFNNINYINRVLTSIDYFLIMLVIIFIKELVIKKRKKGELKNG